MKLISPDGKKTVDTEKAKQTELWYLRHGWKPAIGSGSAPAAPKKV